MTPPEALVHFLKPWADFYSHSKMATTIVTYVHVAGLLLAGGLAIAADRSTLRALRVAAGEREHYMKELGTVHKWVVTGLTLVVASGVALVTADIETFFGSWIYWTKMGLVVLLLINGFMMTRIEQGLQKEASATSPHWSSLRRVAMTSLGLWFTIAFFGIALVNFT
ncbi:MAG: DUF6644 family protein [bacterium]